MADEEITINVRTLDSRSFQFKLPKNTLVAALKSRIATASGYPESQQRIIFQGKVLKNDQPLTAYGLEDGHTLHLVARAPGAPTSSRNDEPRAAPRPAGHTPAGVMMGAFTLPDRAIPDVNLNLNPSDLGQLRMQLDMIENAITQVEAGRPPSSAIFTTTTATGPEGTTTTTTSTSASSTATSATTPSSSSGTGASDDAPRTSASASPPPANVIHQVADILGRVVRAQTRLTRLMETLQQQLALESTTSDPAPREATQAASVHLGGLLGAVGGLYLHLSPVLTHVRMGATAAQGTLGGEAQGGRVPISITVQASGSSNGRASQQEVRSQHAQITILTQSAATMPFAGLFAPFMMGQNQHHAPGVTQPNARQPAAPPGAPGAPQQQRGGGPGAPMMGMQGLHFPFSGVFPPQPPPASAQGVPPAATQPHAQPPPPQQAPSATSAAPTAQPPSTNAPQEPEAAARAAPAVAALAGNMMEMLRNMSAGGEGGPPNLSNLMRNLGSRFGLDDMLDSSGGGMFEGLTAAVMDTLSVPELLMVFTGNRAPLERLHAPLSTLLRGHMEQNNLNATQLVDSLVSSIHASIDDPALPTGGMGGMWQEMRERIIPGRDIAAASAGILRLHLGTLVDMLLADAPAATAQQPHPFAGRLWEWLRDMVGEWLHALSACLQGGINDLPNVVRIILNQTVGVMAGTEIGSAMSMMTGMMTNMLSSFLMNTYRSYVQSHTAAAANSSAWLSSVPPEEAAYWRATVAEDEAEQACMPPQRPFSNAYASRGLSNKRKEAERSESPGTSPSRTPTALGKHKRARHDAPSPPSPRHATTSVRSLLAEQLKASISKAGPVNRVSSSGAASAEAAVEAAVSVPGVAELYASSLRERVSHRLATDSDFERDRFVNAARQFWRPPPAASESTTPAPPAHASLAARPAPSPTAPTAAPAPVSARPLSPAPPDDSDALD